MKIQILSDAHREFYLESGWEPKISKDAEMIICAGDMVTGPEMANRYFSSLREKTDAKILYLLGNHEYWGHSINGAFADYYKEIKDIENLELLNDSWLETEKHVFFGSTLWTDFDNGTKALSALQGMVDFRKIRTYSTDEKPLYEYMMDKHAHTLELLKCVSFAARKVNKKLVVITHHAPSYSCVSNQYKGNPLNAAFVSNLDAKIDEFKPILWIHGHVHNQVDKQIYDTRVICNPCGYPWEKEAYQEELVLEI